LRFPIERFEQAGLSPQITIALATMMDKPKKEKTFSVLRFPTPHLASLRRCWKRLRQGKLMSFGTLNAKTHAAYFETFLG